MANLATRHMGKFSVYVSNDLEYKSPKDDEIWNFVVSEVVRLYGYGNPKYYDYIGNIITSGLFFFDTEKEMEDFYHIFDQELTDSSAIFSCTFCPTSGALTYNT